MEKIEVELVSSLVTIVLAILAVAVFIYHGAGALFYATVIVAMAVGFLNAWLITKAAPEARAEGAVTPAMAKRRRTVSARRTGRRA